MARKKPTKIGKLPFGGVQVVPSTRLDNKGNPLDYRYKAYYNYRKVPVRKTFATPTAAIAWLESEKKLIDAGIWTPYQQRVAQQEIRGLTVGDMLRDHLAKKRVELRPSSYTTLDNCIRLQILPYSDFVNREVVLTTRDHCKNWATRALAKTKNRNAYNKAVSLLTALFEEQVIQDNIPSNPMRSVTRVKIDKQRKNKPLTVGQYLEIIDTFRPEVQGVALLCYLCGLRSSEARAVQLGDINTFTDSTGGRVVTVDVQRSADRNGNIGATKSRAGRRTVPVIEQAQNKLLELVQARLNDGAKSTDFLNTSGRTGKPVTYMFFYNEQRRVAKKLQLPAEALNSHNGRRAVITQLLDNGVSPKTVAAIVGHSTTKMTLDVYAGTSLEQQLVAVAKLSRIISSEGN